MTVTPLKPPIVYPEPDGAPMAESDPARDYLVYGVEALKGFFQGRLNVYVSGNMWLSYKEGDPSAVVCPDVFVVFGVENRPRRSYQVWKEGDKTPDWILEITSKSTLNVDEEEKPLIYKQLGVTEYFQYDPTGEYLKPQLKGQRLHQGRYREIKPSKLLDGTLVFQSEVLGLELRLLPDGRLRFFDPVTQEYLRSPQESEQERLEERQRANLERQRAELERQRAEQADQQAQQERLRAEEERLRAEQADQQAQQERLRAEEERLRAEQADQQAQQERLRAEEERLRAEEERFRAERLADRLRELGIDPD
jgi:Uma2 family endonuclease